MNEKQSIQAMLKQQNVLYLESKTIAMGIWL